jgi:hypothetical protein
MMTPLVALGAVIVIAEAGIAGWLMHRWLIDRAPGVAAWIPRDGGAVLGLLFGAGIVAGWVVG